MLYGLVKKALNLQDIGFAVVDKNHEVIAKGPAAWTQAWKRNSRLRTPIHCIAEDLSVVEWHVERYITGGRWERVHKAELKEGTDAHLLCSLIERPHPLLSQKSFFYLLTTYMELGGVALLLMRRGRDVVRGKQKPDQFRPIPPKDIIATPAHSLTGQWEIQISNKYGHMENEFVDPDQVVCAFRPDPDDPLGAYSGTVTCVDDEVQLDEASLKWILKTMVHGTFLGNIIALPNLQGRKDEIIKNWRANFSGYANAGKDYFISSSEKEQVSVTPLSKSPMEMGLVEQRITTRDMLGQAWQVPPERMGIIENANRSTIDVADFHQQSKNVLPRLIEFRDEFNHVLSKRFGEGKLRLNFQDPVKESQDAKFARIQGGVRLGWVKPNEARAEFGYNDVPLGRGFYLPTNNVTVVDESGKTMLSKEVSPNEQEVFSRENPRLQEEAAKEKSKPQGEDQVDRPEES